MAISDSEYLVTTARDLGAALKRFRTAAGVTQTDAAEAMGIGQPYLSSLEGGKFSSSLTHALRLLRFVGCEVIVRPESHVADRLVAWLYDTPLATLIRAPEFRIRLEWRPEGIERWGLGSPALSVGLPIGAPASPRDMRGLDFFENILPEGPALERMAVLAGVRPVDTYGILAAFGHDCAGAIMVLPEGDHPGGNDGSGYSPMTPGDLERVISALDASPLAAAPERGFRPSLAGFQRKALLGRARDGTWQLPSGDAPSTWILKPDGPHVMAANEAACLQLAAACGLPVPEAELLDVAGLPVLAVKRYDRQDAPAGDIPVRVHQEDGCQATAMPPGLKYEEQGGPALRDFATSSGTSAIPAT